MPLSNYGAMKLASEALCFAAYENFLNNLRVFRFPNVVGCPATHGVIKDFLKKLDKDENCLNVLGNGSQEKSYLHVSDLIKAMIYLSDTNLRGEKIEEFLENFFFAAIFSTTAFISFKDVGSFIVASQFDP